MEVSIPLTQLVTLGVGVTVGLLAFFAKRTLTQLEKSVETLNSSVQAFERTVGSLENRIAVLDGEDARRERHTLRNQVNALLLWRAGHEGAAKIKPPEEETGA